MLSHAQSHLSHAQSHLSNAHDPDAGLTGHSGLPTFLSGACAINESLYHWSHWHVLPLSKLLQTGTHVR